MLIVGGFMDNGSVSRRNRMGGPHGRIECRRLCLVGQRAIAVARHGMEHRRNKISGYTPRQN